MPQYKLFYFNLKSRGELIRYIFAVANVQYEDVRIEFKDWAAEKPKFRFGQTPVLELEGGVQLNQSVAIGHFLAHEHGLCGKGALEDAQCLAIVEQTKDLVDVGVHIYWREKDEEKKKEKTKDFEQGLLKTTLDALEAQCSASDSGYLVGNGLTWADLALYSSLEVIAGYIDFQRDLLTCYPALTAHRDKVGSVDAIRAYQAKRPASEYKF